MRASRIELLSHGNGDLRRPPPARRAASCSYASPTGRGPAVDRRSLFVHRSVSLTMQWSTPPPTEWHAPDRQWTDAGLSLWVNTGSARKADGLDWEAPRGR